MKAFNTAGTCVPSDHYMADIGKRVSQIKKMVDEGEYFMMSRPRQYGKTTMLNELYKALVPDDVVISLDFQDIETICFKDAGSFSKAFARITLDLHEFEGLFMPESVIDQFEKLVERSSDDVKLDDLFRIFRKWFKEECRPIVLMIDEVDRATNNQVFVDFLSKLRSLYLKRRKSSEIRTFQSVILARVTNLKYQKNKNCDHCIREDSIPWNIATDFDIDMSLSEAGIKGMLEEYEADHHTGMNTRFIAKLIRDYTNGYPFLVSRICQIIDRKLVPDFSQTLSKAWTSAGVEQAVNMIVREDNTLFDSLMEIIQNHDKLREQLECMLLRGESVPYLSYDDAQEQLKMYGFIVTDGTNVTMANRIFEMKLRKYFVERSIAR